MQLHLRITKETKDIMYHYRSQIDMLVTETKENHNEQQPTFELDTDKSIQMPEIDFHDLSIIDRSSELVQDEKEEENVTTADEPENDEAGSHDDVIVADNTLNHAEI